MCNTKNDVLEYTRGAEMAFDVIFTMNIIVTFFTSIENDQVNEIKDIKMVYKNAAF